MRSVGIVNPIAIPRSLGISSRSRPFVHVARAGKDMRTFCAERIVHADSLENHFVRPSNKRRSKERAEQRFHVRTL